MTPIGVLNSSSTLDMNNLLTATTILASAAISVFAAEGLKLLVPFRRWFNKSELQSWLAEHNADHLMTAAASESAAEQHAILDQPTGKLMGILQAASTYVLEGRTDERLLRSLAGQMLTSKDGPDDISTWIKNPDLPPSEDALRARDRLEALIERRLDALQARLEYRWMLRNKYATAAIAGVVGTFVYERTNITHDLLITVAFIGAVVLVAAVYSAVIENITKRRAVA
jgi:hypothetical protein